MALKGLGTTSVPKQKPKADYSSHLTTQPVTGMVSSSKAVSGQPVAESAAESKTIHPGVFTDGMSIRIEGGRVINLGNYETARIGVTITVPCTKDSLDEAYAFATGWVSEKIEEAVNQAKE